MNWKPLIQSMLPNDYEAFECKDGSIYIQPKGKEFPASLISIGWLKQHENLPASKANSQLKRFVDLKMTMLKGAV